MSRRERLQRQLSVALREADDADRVWRCTLELSADGTDERSLMDAARRVYAVWQERERARARVADLQRRLQSPLSRSRLRRLRSSASFLRWSVRQQARRSHVSG